MPPKNLTEAQQKFCIDIAKGVNPETAWHNAYPNSSASNSERAANALMQRKTIANYITSLRQYTTTTDTPDLSTREGIIKQHNILYQKALSGGKTSEAARILKDIVQLQGLDTPATDGVDDPNDIVMRLRRRFTHAKQVYDKSLADFPLNSKD